MPGATLPNLSIVLPTLDGDTGVWDDGLNAALTLIDAHNHSPGLGARVPTTGIGINADLTFAGYGATNVGRVAFTAVAALTTGSKAIFVSSVDNELYWRTSAGTNVKLTNGTSINTTLVGGIVGDYTTVGAVVAYDDANDAYTFKQETPFAWARIACGGVRVYEYNTTESVYTGLKPAAALASSYDITLPVAAPGSTSVVLMDSSGVLTVSNTIPNAMTFSTSISTPTIAGTPNFTGAVTMASTLGVTGVITATAGLTSVADVTAADLNYTTEQFVIIPPWSGNEETAATHTKNTNPNMWTLAASAVRIAYPIAVRVGDQITSFNFYIQKITSGATTLTAILKRVKGANPQTLTTVSTVTSAVGAGYVTVGNTGLTETVGTGDYYYVTIESNAAGAGDIIYHLQLGLKRPA